MSLEIVFSNRAEANLDKMIAYLEANWPAKTKMDFLAKLSEQLYLIVEMPFLYPASELKKELRRCLINKNVALYYRVEKTRIVVITIQDTRINPENLLL